MTEMIECPQCTTFVVPPGTCPDCGAEVKASGESTGGSDVVVQYRLNHLAASAGISMAGFVTGAATWLTGRPGFGVALFLGSLLWAALLLLRE